MRPSVLSIAGSDSSGGAGVQADLRTFAALGVEGKSALTAITAQSSGKVYSISPVASEMVQAQIDAVLTESFIEFAKTGMLATQGNVQVAAALTVRLIVDPVLVSTSLQALSDEATRAAMRERLVPKAYLLTPNLDELEWLTGARAESVPLNACVSDDAK